MKYFELKRFKKALGTAFNIFFSSENKRLEQKEGIGKQPDLVLVSFPEKRQTATVTAIRTITGWTVKKATAFVKEGDTPKVIIYNVKTLKKSQLDAIKDATVLKIIIKTY
jgi:hypothetical protein